MAMLTDRGRQRMVVGLLAGPYVLAHGEYDRSDYRVVGYRPARDAVYPDVTKLATRAST
jgi:hypothetical protein